jgi:pimeloyl-ACP methyl ester carboxylesterase
MEMSAIKYKRVDVDGFGVAYREGGPVSGPALLLLHGFPTSSHMFRNLIPKLADRYRVVAPDLPGFGQSDLPSREQFKYTFSNLATVMARFTEVLELHRFAVYVFDYGSPTGLRMAVEHPERVTAIITQNGNAYVVGLSDGWNPIRAYWKEPTQANRDALRTLLTPETTYWQYTTGVKDTSLVSPDGYNLDNYFMTRPGAHEVQLDLFLDYASWRSSFSLRIVPSDTLDAARKPTAVSPCMSGPAGCERPSLGVRTPPPQVAHSVFRGSQVNRDGDRRNLVQTLDKV